MNDAFGENSALGPWWARQGLNLRPHPCEGCALPLSYAPVPNDVAAADVRKPDVHSRCGADCNGVLCIGFRPMQTGPRWKPRPGCFSPAKRLPISCRAEEPTTELQSPMR